MNIYSYTQLHNKEMYSDIFCSCTCQDIDNAYRCVKVLNGKTATLVALVLFNFVSHTIRGKGKHVTHSVLFDCMKL